MLEEHKVKKLLSEHEENGGKKERLGGMIKSVF